MKASQVMVRRAVICSIVDRRAAAAAVIGMALASCTTVAAAAPASRGAAASTATSTAFRYVSPTSLSGAFAGESSGGMRTTTATTATPAPVAPAGPVGEDDWWVQPSVAIWLPGIEGEVGVRGSTASVDSTFIDILDDSDSVFGITGELDVGKGRLGAYVSGSWMKVEATGGLENRTSVRSEIGLLAFGLSYDLWRAPMSYTATDGRGPRDLVVQVRAGARCTNVDARLSHPDFGARSRDEDWIDPMIGARVTIPISHAFSVVLAGEVGGFGAASEFAWSAGGLISWDFHLGDFPSSLQLGYLAVGDDYQTGQDESRFVWDTTLHGPILNLTVRF